MNLRKAAQQALEALEEYEKSYQAVADGLKPLRAALAEDVPETNFGNMAQAVDCYGDGNVYHTNGMPAVEGPLSKAQRTGQESPQVEPVAWMWKYRRLDGSVVRVTTYRNQHPPKELDFILENLGEDAIPLYAENPLQNIHPKTGTTACLMQSPEFRLTPWSEK